MPVPALEPVVQQIVMAPARREGVRVVAKAAGTAMARDGLVLSGGAKMLAEARALMAATRDNAYAHIPEIAPERGYFRADCSELIDYLAGHVRNDALAGVPLDAGHGQPRADNWQAFLAGRPAAGTPAARHGWGQVPAPGALQPGDVIAWRNMAYTPGHGDTGHIMLVAGAPAPVARAGKVVGYDVPIIDSTSHGHGLADDRLKGVKSGLGQGAVFFPVDATGAATGFSWTPSAVATDLPPRPPTLGFGRLD